MNETLRVTVNAPDNDTATEVKERFFKELYEHAGTKVVFEFPADAKDDADAVVAFAEEKDCKAEVAEHKDDLDQAEPVDFW